MSIYAYQPVRALQIIDSAVIVDNLNDVRADIARARIYSSSQRKDELDSMLGGPAGIRFDTARAIGERVLRHDSVKVDLKKQKSILEILTYVARMQEDTTRWMLRAGELLNVCHQLGAGSETDALRTEAEIGAALYVMGQQEQGMAKLDSAIFQLESSFIGEDKKGAFNELDALIVALKRKISVLSKNDKYAETLPLARSIIERLADYEQHPDDYHDDSPREPKDATQRIDYIEFYRNQAQNFITAAYTALSEDGSMIATFEDIERKELDATTREHLARYNALEQRMKAEHHQLEAKLQQGHPHCRRHRHHRPAGRRLCCLRHRQEQNHQPQEQAPRTADCRRPELQGALPAGATGADASRHPTRHQYAQRRTAVQAHQ